MVASCGGRTQSYQNTSQTCVFLVGTKEFLGGTKVFLVQLPDTVSESEADDSRLSPRVRSVVCLLMTCIVIDVYVEV